MNKKKIISEYMAKKGAKGGKSRSAAKVRAVRKNGKKGGRPKWQPSLCWNPLCDKCKRVLDRTKAV